MFCVSRLILREIEPVSKPSEGLIPMNSDFQSLLQLAIGFNVGIVAYATIFRNSLQVEGDRVRRILEFAERRRISNLEDAKDIGDEREVVEIARQLFNDIEQRIIHDDNLYNGKLALGAYICVLPAVVLLFFSSFYADIPASWLVGLGSVLFNIPMILFVISIGYHRYRVIRPYVKKRDDLRLRLNKIVRDAALA